MKKWIQDWIYNSRSSIPDSLLKIFSMQVQLEDPAPSPRWYTEHMCRFYRKGFLPHRHAYLSGVKKDTGYTGYSALDAQVVVMCVVYAWGRFPVSMGLVGPFFCTFLSASLSPSLSLAPLSNFAFSLSRPPSRGTLTTSNPYHLSYSSP
jgi:hypothetical protein